MVETSSRPLVTPDLRLGFSEATELSAAIQSLALGGWIGPHDVGGFLDGADLLELTAADVMELADREHPDVSALVRRVWHRHLLPQWEYATDTLGREIRALSVRLDGWGPALLVSNLLRGAAPPAAHSPAVTALVPSVFLPARATVVVFPSDVALTYRVPTWLRGGSRSISLVTTDFHPF